MLSVTEQVWRHLYVSAEVSGHRRWPSASALARELGLGSSSVHRALERPIEIQSVRIPPAGGLVLLDPARLLMLWAGRRRPVRDIIDRYQVANRAIDVERAVANPAAVIGGFGAITAAIGANTIADYSTVVIYGDPQLRDLAPDADSAEPGFEPADVWVLEPDPRLARYGRATPLAQAWVDLFNMPGWQAARFVHTLLPRMVADAA